MMYKKTQSNSQKAAFTLMEIMVGLFVFGLICLGLLSTILQTRRVTEGSIFHSTSMTIAQGYLSQLMEMNYDNFDNSVINNLITQNSEESLTLSTTSNRNLNERFIDIKNTPSTSSDDMKMDFYVYVEDLDDSTVGIEGAKKVTIDYTYYFGGDAYNNSIKSIRSNVTSK
ncbi:type II secretion system GspH family protein [Puniceicoccaceae bacterium K14]|nr:type II secretion system GspH family protein [Puniceicoccaceae bacterium K14]